MFGKTFKLFTVLGFTVKMDISWLIVMLLIVYSLSAGVFPNLYPDLTWQAHVLMGLGGAVGLFLSIVIHELCHSLVARRYGMSMKGITLFLFGGVAEMADEPPDAKSEFLMAAAGPAASVAIGTMLWGLGMLGFSAGWPSMIVGVVRWVGVLNFILAIFNMIPAFPLDGGRILRSILWGWKKDLRRSTQLASHIGSGFGIVLIVLGALNLFTMNPVGGLWWILIGLFIRSAARQSYRQVLIRQALHGEPVFRFMNDHPVTVPGGASLQQLVDDYVYRHHHKMFPVVDETGQLVGVVTLEQVKAIPREQWDATRVDQVARPCTEETAVPENQDAMEALNVMSRSDNSRLLVVDQARHLRGILSLKDLLQFLALKLELEGQSPRGRLA